MNSSEPLSSRQFPASLPKGYAIALLVFAFVGFVDASYLTVNHYLNAIPPCSLTGGCETVLTSTYAVVAGIPVALWGMLYYLLVFFLTLVFRANGSKRRALLFLEIVGAGLIGSLSLLYLQLFVINAICLYCLVSLTINALLFVTAFLMWRKTPEA